MIKEKAKRKYYAIVKCEAYYDLSFDGTSQKQVLLDDYYFIGVRNNSRSKINDKVDVITKYILDDTRLVARGIVVETRISKTAIKRLSRVDCSGIDDSWI